VSSTVLPWNKISRPSADGMIAMRRVDATLRQDMFWGLDHRGHQMIILQCARLHPSECRLPELKDIAFRVEKTDERFVLALSLIDSDKADIFKVFCDDLIAAVGQLPCEQDAVTRLIDRSFRWHHLLRSSGRRSLSELEQRGLIAELIALRDVAIPALGVESAVAAWRGPFGAPQDFLIPGFRLEVKSTEPPNPRRFFVSSEHQLDRAGAGGDVVSVALVEVARSTGSNGGGETLSDLVDSIRKICEVAGGSASRDYEHRLMAVGFADADIYRVAKWTFKAPVLIEVGINFPSIAATSLPRGVSGVSYECDLGDYEITHIARPFGKGKEASLDN